MWPNDGIDQLNSPQVPDQFACHQDIGIYFITLVFVSRGWIHWIYWHTFKNIRTFVAFVVSKRNAKIE